MSPKDVSEYLKDGGMCPFCGSDINAPVVVGPNTTELNYYYDCKTGENTVRQQVKCPACGSL